MQTWEYSMLTRERTKNSEGEIVWVFNFYHPSGKRELDGGIVNALNELGADGWELVTLNMEYMRNTAAGTPGSGNLAADLVDYYFKRHAGVVQREHSEQG